MKTTRKVSTVVLSGLCLLQLAGPARAEEDKPTASLAVSAMSKYVWRGFENSRDSLVIEPSMTVGYQGFSANLWGNEDTRYYSADPSVSTTSAWTETDLTLAYDWTMGPVGLTGGYIYYGLAASPYGGADVPDTQEVFAKAALKTLLTPTLTVYRDIDNLPGWYATLGVSQTLPITKEIGLSLGAQVGYLRADDASSYARVSNPSEPCRGFHDGLLSASVAYPVNKYITVTPSLNYSFPLTSDARDLIKSKSFTGNSDFVYGGITVALAF